MIVSHRFRYIFIRCRKTASTTTEIHLSRHVGADDVVTSFCERDEVLRAHSGGTPPQNTGHPAADAFYNHMPAAAVRSRLGETIWTSYFRFCFERNPWDKAISLYFHRHRSPDRIPFDEFLESGEVLDCRNIGLYTINGRVAVDFVGRYESLASDLHHACRRIGIPMASELSSAKSQFRTDRRSYRDFLDDAQRRRIALMFGDEIELHRYVY